MAWLPQASAKNLWESNTVDILSAIKEIIGTQGKILKTVQSFLFITKCIYYIQKWIKRKACICFLEVTEKRTKFFPSCWEQYESQSHGSNLPGYQTWRNLVNASDNMTFLSGASVSPDLMMSNHPERPRTITVVALKLQVQPAAGIRQTHGASFPWFGRCVCALLQGSWKVQLLYCSDSNSETLG